MNSTADSAQAIAVRLEAQQEDLNFFQRLLAKPGDTEEKRRELLSYCRRQSVAEPTVWWKLALFREAGATGLLNEIQPYRYFDLTDERLREQILAGIKKLPRETLGDFRELVIFTGRFLERVRFLCDALLHLFLQREKGAYRESEDMSLYTDFFDQKIFRELDVIHEITDRYPFATLNDRYEQWLCDKVLDEEAPV
jgi:hypothetical protein